MIPGRISERDGIETEVSIAADTTMLQGTLRFPENPRGIVLFAHGSGSSRHSPRNRYVAQALHSQGIATLLFDLLTREEETIDRLTGQLRFDIDLLAERLVSATRWVMRRPDLQAFRIGYFGASTGAGAALVAAAKLPDAVAAVVSRGGRPDLAEEALGSVRAATLLIVGGNDEPVIAMNRQALAKLRCPDKKLVIVPGATHLFEEPGTLEEVARIAAEWFTHHLGTGGRTQVSASSERLAGSKNAR
jgi:putative phosphoribosyl transferase